jgi:hypothetical protein
LTPDQSLLTTGGNTSGEVLSLAARHKDGKWAVVYCADPRTISVAMGKLLGKARAYWIDPRTGASKSIGSFANSGTRSFTTPTGWEDATLLLVTQEGLVVRGKVGGGD